MPETCSTDVVVVGAGPTGLATALSLTRRGVRVAIVDKYHRSALHSYALALHPTTLGLLDEWELAAPLLERGQPVRSVVINRGPERVAEISLAVLPGDYPYALVIPQSLVEAALERALTDAGIRVEWGCQLLNVDPDEGSVEALVGKIDEDPDRPPETRRIRARCLVGADGRDSVIRRRLGFGRRLLGDPVTYSLMEFTAPIQAPDEMRLVLDDTTLDGMWPLGPERGRWSVQLEPGASCVDGDAEPARRRLRARAGWFDVDEARLEWATTVCFEPWMASRFGAGRVWLVGDSARMTLPLGVQNMNVGIREANDLARRIASVLERDGSSRLLEHYNDQRTREWQVRLGVKGSIRPLPEAPGSRESAHRLAAALPETGRNLNLLLEQIGLRMHWLRHLKYR